MNHFTSSRFWECYQKLPKAIQKTADKQFQLLKQTPANPSLHLKKVGNYWSARIGLRYRALAIEKNGDLIWFWIGTHADYDKLVSV